MISKGQRVCVTSHGVRTDITGTVVGIYSDGMARIKVDEILGVTEHTDDVYPVARLVPVRSGPFVHKIPMETR